MNRRNFFFKTLELFGAITIYESCKRSVKSWLLSISGTNHILGHRLWAKNFPPISETITTKYVIIGGGISGLSAARAFNKSNISDFLLLEMEHHIGGNASNGENKYAKYPHGAHYLPIPNKEDALLIEFLEEEGIIKGYKDGQPIFDSFQTSFPPQERLFYKGTWQEDLIPKVGISEMDKEELTHLFHLMQTYRTQKGKDGKYWFDIPLINASSDKENLQLDTLSMKVWLIANNFKSTPLHWYINYCCRDDYGLSYESISAWAGIHYFAGRKQNFAPQLKDNVLTWPEGNAHLATLLSKYSSTNTLKNTLVYDVAIKDNQVNIKTYNEKTNQSKLIIAEKVIIATPQFVNKHILPDRDSFTRSFQYAPWIIATLTINGNLDGENYPLCWDNVIYGGKGLGYVYDQNQSIAQMHDVKVISYYLPFSDENTAKSRKQLLTQTNEYWEKEIIEDLKTSHPYIESQILEIEIFKIGHGMISPTKNFIFGADKAKAQQPIANKIYFAHSDLSGISIFEEAFHQGIKAVKDLLNE